MSKEVFNILTSFKTKKNDGTYGDMTYIGTDSRFVTMPSGLSLGEESFMGKNAVTVISKVDDTETRIVESYGKEEDNKSFYYKETTIKKLENNTKITEVLKIKLYNIESSGFTEETVKTKETTIGLNGVIEEKFI